MEKKDFKSTSLFYLIVSQIKFSTYLFINKTIAVDVFTLINISENNTVSFINTKGEINTFFT